MDEGNLLHLITDTYASALDFENLRFSEADPTKHRLIADGKSTGPRTVVINVVTVGGRNSGSFQGWVKLGRGDMRRIHSVSPAFFEMFTLVIGFAPDDERIWWFAMYRDRDLAEQDFESMDDGRWYRLDATAAASCGVMVGERVVQNLIENTFWDVPPAFAPVEDRRAEAEATIDAGLEALLNDELMKHLDQQYLVSLPPRLGRAVENVGKWREVRHQQSYSRERGRSKR